MTQEVCQEVVTTYLKQLRLSRMARECEAVAREAEQRGLGYLGFLQALLEGELASRQEQQLRRRLKAAAFPYQKSLEDFDFSLVPSSRRSDCWSWRKAPSCRLTTMCCSLVPAGSEKPIC